MYIFDSTTSMRHTDLPSQGTKDRTVPYRYSTLIQKILSTPADSKCRTTLVTVDGGAHDLTITHADSVLKAFDDVMKAYDDGDEVTQCFNIFPEQY